MVLAQALNERADFDDLVGVEPHRRLVQNQYRRIADEGLCEADPLPIALGQVLDKPSVHVGDFHQPADLRDMLGAGQGAFLKIVHEVQIFAHRHVQIQRRLLRQVADVGLGLIRLLQHVVAVDFHNALRRRQIAGENVHGSGFSRAVRPQEPEDFALFHCEADMVHGAVPAISLRQVLYLDHGFAIPPVSIRAGKPRRALLSNALFCGCLPMSARCFHCIGTGGGSCKQSIKVVCLSCDFSVGARGKH